MKINDDASFDRANDWLIKRGESIANGDLAARNPLLDAAARERWRVERAEHMRLYDIVDAEMTAYRQKLFFGKEEPRTALDAWLDD